MSNDSDINTVHRRPSHAVAPSYDVDAEKGSFGAGSDGEKPRGNGEGHARVTDADDGQSLVYLSRLKAKRTNWLNARSPRPSLLPTYRPCVNRRWSRPEEPQGTFLSDVGSALVASPRPERFLTLVLRFRPPLLSHQARHLAMIALGGTIGTGLFVGSGSALSRGGPVGTL
jgi:hypothetical protein